MKRQGLLMLAGLMLLCACGGGRQPETAFVESSSTPSQPSTTTVVAEQTAQQGKYQLTVRYINEIEGRDETKTIDTDESKLLDALGKDGGLRYTRQNDRYRYHEIFGDPLDDHYLYFQELHTAGRPTGEEEVLTLAEEELDLWVLYEGEDNFVQLRVSDTKLY